ncbi:MAG: DUF6702 family protein [Spirosomataceae bacterium]
MRRLSFIDSYQDDQFVGKLDGWTKAVGFAVVMMLSVLAQVNAKSLPNYRFLKHAFHTSLTQIDHNPKEKSLEVSIRMFTDDLESTLSKENNGQRFRIENNDKNDPFVERYVRKHFKLTNAKGQSKAYTYVGKENEGDATWVYIEIPLQESDIQGFKLQQDVLVDAFDDQVNIVNVTFKGERKSYVYNAKKLIHELQ